jgi:hypothetical protein
MKSIVRRVSAAMLVVSSAACGGGGSGDGGFGGDFHLVGYETEASGTPLRASIWGSAEMNGGFSMTITANSDTTILGPVTQDALDFSVSDDGDFLLVDPAEDDETILAGCVAEDGNVIASASVRENATPLVFAMARTTNGATAADLSGAYRYTFFAFDGSGRSSSGVGSFDGAGSGGLNAGGAIVNVDGALDSISLASPLGYSVGSDGSVSLTVGLGSLPFSGGMDPSRELLLFGGSSAPGALAGLLLFVKAATSASNATFQGDYCMVGFSFDFATPAMRSFTGVLSADGAGNATAQGTANVQGTIAPTLAASHTYSVAADGTLTLTTPEGTFVGGVSPSGDFAIVGGPDTDGADPGTYLLVRR